MIREKGTPQGGVISPLLANLYLHEAFDCWMSQAFPQIKFERYADDIVVHCVSEKQAYFLKMMIEKRLKEFRLSLHEEKTRIIYTGTCTDYDNRGHKLSRKFTFLGYDFKPRYSKGRIRYSPGMGSGAFKIIRGKIREQWRLNRRLSNSLEEIAEEVNPVIRGWINYYGHYRRSDLYRLATYLDERLAGFLKRKSKRCKSWNKAWAALKLIKRKNPQVFCHWYMISQSKR